MHAIHDLKEMLCGELEEYGKKETLTMQDLDMVDKLAHATKNIDKIIEYSENHRMEESSGRMYIDRSYDSCDYSGRRGRGSNARRDSMGRYSTSNDMVYDLRQMMQQTQDEKTRREFENFIQKIETM